MLRLLHHASNIKDGNEKKKKTNRKFLLMIITWI